MKDYRNSMRRHHRTILKWIILSGICAIVFKAICDGLVDIFLSASVPSIANVKDSNYEDLLIGWAATGQRVKNEKFSMEKIPNRHDLELIGAQIVFRHGARTPLHLLPNLEEVHHSIRKD